jgi:hypothetical protein
MGVMPAWSYSSLTAFENCPKRYNLVRMQKAVPDPPGKAALWGIEVHKHLELFVKDGKPLPDDIAHYAGIMSIVTSHKGEKYPEQQLAVSASFDVSGWWDKSTWCRGVIDLMLVNKDKATVLDWKTGKRKPDSAQLKLFAGLVFANYPEIDRVNTGFVWLLDGKLDTEAFTRNQIGEIWNSFLPRVRRMEIAYETDTWQAKPSGLCRAYCPVGKARCEFCGT